jgi:hypothetical protein
MALSAAVLYVASLVLSANATSHAILALSVIVLVPVTATTGGLTVSSASTP